MAVTRSRQLDTPSSFCYSAHPATTDTPRFPTRRPFSHTCIHCLTICVFRRLSWDPMSRQTPRRGHSHCTVSIARVPVCSPPLHTQIFIADPIVTAPARVGKRYQIGKSRNSLTATKLFSFKSTLLFAFYPTSVRPICLYIFSSSLEAPIKSTLKSMCHYQPYIPSGIYIINLAQNRHRWYLSTLYYLENIPLYYEIPSALNVNCLV